MMTDHSNEFGGDPFPVQGPKRHRRERGSGPLKGGRQDEEKDEDPSKIYDLGGGD